MLKVQMSTASAAPVAPAASPFQPIHLRVRVPGGSVLSVSVPSGSLLRDVKWHLYQQTGTPIRYIRLMRLSDSESLSSAFDSSSLDDLNVRSGDQLKLAMLPPDSRQQADATEKICERLRGNDALVRALRHDKLKLQEEIQALKAQLQLFLDGQIV